MCYGSKMRKNPKRDEWLRDRLREAVTVFAEGNAEEFSRMLGHMNGGFIREILAGTKQVRAAIIDAFNAAEDRRLHGWFGEIAPLTASAPESLGSIVERLGDALQELERPARLGVLGILSGLGDHPEEAIKLGLQAQALADAAKRRSA